MYVCMYYVVVEKKAGAWAVWMDICWVAHSAAELGVLG